MPRTELSSARLRLRAFTDRDAALLVSLDSDPEVMRYLTGGTPTPSQVIVDEILPLFVSSHADHPLFGFRAAEEHDRFVGWFSLRPTDDAGTTSLGYRLVRRAWGRGLATEGAAVLVDHAFRRPGVTRIVATTYEENVASVRVLQHLGMRLARRFRYSQTELADAETSRPRARDVWPGDDLEYVLDRHEWRGVSP